MQRKDFQLFSLGSEEVSKTCIQKSERNRSQFRKGTGTKKEHEL